MYVTSDVRLFVHTVRVSDVYVSVSVYHVTPCIRTHLFVFVRHVSRYTYLHLNRFCLCLLVLSRGFPWTVNVNRRVYP